MRWYRFPALRHLDLRCGHATDKSVVELGALSGLLRLDLDGCKLLTAEGLANIARLSSVTTLSLRNCSQASAATITPLLTYGNAAWKTGAPRSPSPSFIVYAWQFATALPWLLSSRQTRSLRCHATQVSWSSLGVLAGMPRLTSLNCAGIRFSSPTDDEPQEPAPGLEQLLQQLESLTIGDGMALVRVGGRHTLH